jgi:hypothetical protein
MALRLAQRGEEGKPGRRNNLGRMPFNPSLGVC